MRRVRPVVLCMLAVTGVLFALLATGSSARGEDVYAEKRAAMVSKQMERRGIHDPKVLKVMGEVPRHLFVPKAYRPLAYEDRPLPIGKRQTISQPYIVAFMTEALALKGDEKVLEIGTGSGYQTAVLSPLCKHIYSIEIIKVLANRARKRLQSLGYTNVTVRHGDGYQGWPEEAPFNAIVVTAAPPKVPPKLVEQLAVGGRMVVPVGTAIQELLLITRTGEGTTEKKLLPVRFVPMVHGKE